VNNSKVGNNSKAEEKQQSSITTVRWRTTVKLENKCKAREQ
jgi:hypothetical protein